MKTAKTVDLIFLSIWLLQLLAEGLTLFGVWKLDMLPGKYLLLLAAVLLVLLLLTGALLFWRRKRSEKMTLRRWIACVLILGVIAGCGLASYVVDHLRSTIDNVTTQNPADVMMAVYVRVDDKAASLQDAADYQFASVQDYEEARTAQVVAHISQQLGKEISTIQYRTVFDMINALLNGEVDAIILNSAYVDILEGVELYSDFAEKTRVLYEIPVAADPAPQQPTDTTQPSTDTTPATESTEPVIEKTVTNSPFVLYLSGSDTRSSKLRTSLSDVNILVVVNPVDKQILLLNTPRDYYIPNPAGNGARDKLTHCGIYGVNCSIQALSNLYGIQVDYYAQINFTGFQTLIDAIGGVTVYSDAAFTAGNVRFQKGENFLDGRKALAFARERYNVAGGDNGRGKNQMKIMTATIHKLTSSTALITNYSAIMQSLQGMFATSMGSSEISQLVKMQLDDMAQWDVLSYAVTGVNGRDITYSMPGQKVSVMYVDQTLVDHGSSLVKRMLAGEVLTNEDIKAK